jgi:predicted flap endonuclease-1-like 5' DNA nuclease
MRLDYILYGLGIIFLGLSAVSFLLVAAPDGQLLYVVSTAVLGVFSIIAGVAQWSAAKALKSQPATAPPKVESSSVVETTPASPVVAEQPIQAPTDAEPAKAAEAKVEETPAAPVQVEEPKVETAPVPVNEPTVEAPTVAPVSEAPKPEAHVAEAPVVQAEPATPTSAPQQAPAVEAATEPVFSKIRGISEKRAAQLKANGIATIEQLANASADDLAAKLAVSPRIVKMWIGSAKKLVK